MIKAIFLDIDGTLISGKRPSIKKEVIEGLKQVRKKGIQLFIASGRHMLELEELKRQVVELSVNYIEESDQNESNFATRS